MALHGLPVHCDSVAKGLDRLYGGLVQHAGLAAAICRLLAGGFSNLAHGADLLAGLGEASGGLLAHGVHRLTRLSEAGFQVGAEFGVYGATSSQWGVGFMRRGRPALADPHRAPVL